MGSQGTGSEGNHAPHADLMDQVYRRQRHIYDLTRKYYLLGRDRLVRDLRAREHQSIVEIGCGTARNLILVHQSYPKVRLYGLDASEAMLQTARESLASAGIGVKAVLRQGLAEEMRPSLFGLTQPFDHAVFSYSLSMIPDWRGALLAAADATAPEGRIHIVDFGDLKGLWLPAARGLRAWLRLFHVAPRDELLGALETGEENRAGRLLYILPGRYAFVFQASPAVIRKIALLKT